MNHYDLHNYDKYIVSYSGGKDSTACFLYLLDQGIPKEKIELWHQEIDGREQTFFDWEVTPDYCRKFAEAFGVKIYFQWKEGGFYRELMRENTLTAPNYFELPEGTIDKVGGIRGQLGTRRKFPQCSHDLRVRWCSSYLKISVYSAALTNQPRFRNIRTLVLSGERGEESPARAQYAIFETDRTDLRHGKQFTRHVDHLRPLRDWKEAQVWDIIQRYRIRVHPCYYMGWNRCSCKFCILGNKDQFASAAKVSPDQFNRIVNCEKEFDCTIKRNTDLTSFTAAGTPYPAVTDELKNLATGYRHNRSVIFLPNEQWILPAGAYKKSCPLH